MSDIEQKAVEVLDGWNERLLQLADELTEAAKAHGPDMADLVLAAGRVGAAQELIGPLIAFGIGAGMAYVGYRLLMWEIPFEQDEQFQHIHVDMNEDKRLRKNIAGTLCTVFGGLIGVIGLGSLADLWAWVGIFEPKLWLAHKLLGL